MNTLSIDTGTFTPSKIVCIGRNYRAHIEELGNETPDAMVVFNKPNSAISDALYATVDGETLHYEGEICFAIRGGTPYAVGFGLDLTRRELQTRLKNKGLPWERAKAFNGAACFSPFVEIGDRDLASLTLQLDIDGECRQRGGYELMIHKPDQIVAGIKAFMDLEDGDVIMTGTPAGVGEVHAGARYRGSVFADGEMLVCEEWVALHT